VDWDETIEGSWVKGLGPLDKTCSWSCLRRRNGSVFPTVIYVEQEQLLLTSMGVSALFRGKAR